ncbi:MAG: hypothetical protein WCF15_00270 [Pseudolabrys sp.]
MTDKPPPTARSARDRQQMDKWSNEQLDDFAERSMFWLRGENMDLKVARELSGSGDPIRAAKFGDVDPLRKAYPQIAEYINLPLRKGQGKKLPKDKWAVLSRKVENSLTRAVWDAARLRAIWVDQYGKRPKNYQSAEEIAARRHEVEVDHVERWKRSSDCPRDPWGPHGSRKKRTTPSR